MRSISSLTKRVISMTTAVHFASLQPTVSWALTTRPSSSSSSDRVKNTRHRQFQRQPRLCALYSSSTALGASGGVTTTTATTTPKVTNNNHDDDERILMQSMLYRIRDCNQIPDDLRSVLIEFRLDGLVLGKVDPKVAEILCSTSVVASEDGPSRPVFELASAASATNAGGSSIDNNDNGNAYLTLSDEASGTTSESRTRAVASVMEELRQKGIVTGWRDELYPVSDSFYNPPLFLIERAATDLLGILGYGVHVNGILLPDQQQKEDDETGDGSENNLLPLMWMARRSKTKSKYPSMLDHVVAGGQPAGLGLVENVIKECEEEAGIPPELARPGIDLRSVGVISYEVSKKHEYDDYSSTGTKSSFYMISRVVLFNYDLYLPGGFVPKPVDGEVEEFFLWSVDQIKESMGPDYSDPIKPNCYLVIIDYLLRMGYVSPETEGYLDVFRELRCGDCR